MLLILSRLFISAVLNLSAKKYNNATMATEQLAEAVCSTDVSKGFPVFLPPLGPKTGLLKFTMSSKLIP